MPRSSSSSRTALTTPRVTSSTGASTVVGASPRQVRRYSPAAFFSIRIALVVVEPQSVAITERTASGSIARADIGLGVSPPRFEPPHHELDRAAPLDHAAH